MDKVLWVVSYNSLSKFVQRAKAAKVTAVAIRTSNDVAQAIPAFQGEGMKVFGWRWPSAKKVPAMNEANRAVALFAKGMDGCPGLRSSTTRMCFFRKHIGASPAG